MFCKNCGKENTDDSVFCISCGTKIADLSSLSGEEREQQQEGMAPSQEAPTSAEEKNNQQKQKPIKAFFGEPKNKIVIAIAAFVVLIIVAISISMLPSKEYRVAKDAIDDLVYYNDECQSAINLGDYDLAEDWLDLFKSASDTYLDNYFECSEDEQQKLSEYYDEEVPF